MRSPWTPGPQAAPDAAFRLFCFAHAGGGSSAFREWRGAFGTGVDVRPVLLPGREARLREPPVRRMDELLGPLCAGLLPLLDRPFAFFGHSLGAVVAYETARELALCGGPRPEHLLVSARRAPHLPSRQAPVHRLAEGEFLRVVAEMGGTPADVIAQPGLLRAFLPGLRADFELNETYVPRARGVLDCPVSAFAGDRDPQVAPDEMAAWRDTTRGPFRLRVLPGGHFYLREDPAALTALIRPVLTAARP
ncbi:alpha/beta fold hydrolase [Streptomyces sanyensis]|uniref:Alpha/beta fold hydrolase n=1 Tax=Streptomyces sanyensis TaxID=568869 RepID=A0ABP9A0P6_9ACTN